MYLNFECKEDTLNQKIYTDEKRVKQIIINLISNALKYTFKGGITVSFSERL